MTDLNLIARQLGAANLNLTNIETRARVELIQTLGAIIRLRRMRICRRASLPSIQETCGRE